MLGFPILYLKGMRIMMFQLSGFYYTPHRVDSESQSPCCSRISCFRSPIHRKQRVFWLLSRPTEHSLSRVKRAG